MNKIKIIWQLETSSNGKYHQPRYDFTFGEWSGRFNDTSCGDFGTRYDLLMTNGENLHSANWGSLYKNFDWAMASTFPEQFPEKGFYKAFEEMFGVKIPIAEKGRCV